MPADYILAPEQAYQAATLHNRNLAYTMLREYV
jgi:hypothetical protein